MALDKLPRRQVLGTMAATAIASAAGMTRAAGLTGASGEPAASPSETDGEAAPSVPLEREGRPPLRTMTLKEFLADSGGESAGDVLAKMDCRTFMMCHKKMREETGVWIPELVPVFEKLDKMRGN